MPVDALSSTTLGAALNATSKDVVVSSTSGMAVGDILACREEGMLIQRVISSTQVEVSRGWQGTDAREHPNLRRVYFGGPDKFQNIRESALSMFGDSDVYPEYLLPGQRAFDGAGNEYILLDSLSSYPIYSGCTVVFRPPNFYARQLQAGYQGMVALAVEPSSSDQFFWGQIYGDNPRAQLNNYSGANSENTPVGCTVISTPNAGLEATENDDGPHYVVHGMFISGASTAESSATSTTGGYCPVWLNYPYAATYATTLSAATSQLP